MIVLTPKIVSVIAARNEEDVISKTISSLLQQTKPPELIIVVDDGSTDNTPMIVKEFPPSKVKLIVRKDRIGGPSLLGTPMMALPFNIAFHYLKKEKINYDYLMISGADCFYPEKYLEKLLEKFKQNPSLVIASGIQKGEKINPDHVRGAGRLIKKDFWEFYGGEYPFPSHLWESGILFKAKMLGKQVRSFTDIEYYSPRQSGTNIDMIRYGRILRAINYPFLIVLGRGFKMAYQKNIRKGFRLIAGYLMSPVASFDADKEIGTYINKYLLLSKIKQLMNFFF
ncbi:MAG: glycosyltransferase [Candidatus Heimdallarchaeota archaeon]|nr:glycosyltransferase [Candidatus Heimdallarchaeota archaeon]